MKPSARRGLVRVFPRYLGEWGMMQTESDPKLIAEFRRQVAAGSSVAGALRTIVQLASLESDKLTQVKLAKAAFCLSLREAKPICGWEADGSGELNDERLNSLLIPHVERHRDEWSESP